MQKISVLSMFRDSESYIENALRQLDSLERETLGFSFEYFFYENDSEDNTVAILNEWLSSKEGFLISEQLGRPKFSQSSAAERQIIMTDYRTRLLSKCKPLSSSYSFLLDSDVSYGPNIINEYLDFLTEDVSMVTPNITQNIKCKMFDPSKDSYYDSWALLDSNGNQGMTWAHNPFYLKEDRENWENNIPVSVQSAFGGCPLIKTDVLNKIHWATEGGCEHWHLCRMAREYGSVIVIPSIMANVEIEDQVFPYADIQMKEQHNRLSFFSGF